MSARARASGGTAFLNVDLDLSSREDLASLVRALGPRLFVLHAGRVGGRYRARLELGAQPRTPDAAIRRLVSAIERLSRRERARWNRAESRQLNIGIQAREGPHAREFPIAPATVAMAARVGARIVITVYGAAGEQA